MWLQFEHTGTEKMLH